MKFRKIMATLLAGVMTLSLAACGQSATGTESASTDSATTEEAPAAEAAENTNTETAGTDGEKLVIWTLAKDLQTFAEKYVEDHNVQIETVVIEPADYVTKVQTALNG